MNNSAGSSFRLGTVLAILFPIGILLSIGFLAWGYLDLPGKIARMGRPPLVLVKGKVIFEGKPLAGATLETKMENGSAEGAIAFTNDDGNFVFQTDVTEGRANGAFAGKHKITVKRFDHTAPVSAGAPPLMTPADYSDFAKTPLSVEITAESAKSPLELVVEGKVKVQPNGEYLHKGIATRDFKHQFTLAETVVVRSADVVNGLLVVRLENVIPEEKLPRKIMIGDASKRVVAERLAA